MSRAIPTLSRKFGTRPWWASALEHGEPGAELNHQKTAVPREEHSDSAQQISQHGGTILNG